jgi:tetratricopeptide (TPR) repeat protein
MASLVRAEEVDPLAAVWPAFTASAASWVGRPDVARAAIRRALRVNADLPIAQYIYGTILALDADYDAAIEAERRAAKGNPAWRFGLGYVLARAGQREEARRIAADLARDPDGLAAWGLAEIHAWLGEPDEAFRWLEVAFAARWNWILWLDFNPAFAPLREDPRFEALLRRAGAPRSPGRRSQRGFSDPTTNPA